MLFLVFVVVVICIVGWIYGEAANNKPIRILSTLLCFVVFSIVTAGVASVHATFNSGLTYSSAVYDYFDAASFQIQHGNSQFVINEFAGFNERAQITYEGGILLNALAEETARMKAGPTE